MTRAILQGDPAIEVTLRRSAQARRLSLRVSRLDGRVTLSMPRWTPEREAMGFLREKEGWIRSHLARRPGEQQVRIGGVVPFAGREMPIVEGGGRAARIEGAAMVVPPSETMAPARIAAFLKLQARLRLAEASGRYAEALGRPYGRITLRDTRSRWGSCSQDGNLMYSWRLIMAPPEVLDYVAAHEVAHLAEMNHSPAYWAVLAGLMPGYEAPRAWLRREGAALHGWRF